MSLRFSARSEWFWGVLPFFRNPQELRHIHGQRGSEFVQQIHARAERLPLDVADVSAIDICVHGERLLAQASSTANAAQIPSYSGATLHGPQAINLKQNKPSDISDTIKTKCAEHTRGNL